MMVSKSHAEECVQRVKVCEREGQTGKPNLVQMEFRTPHHPPESSSLGASEPEPGLQPVGQCRLNVSVRRDNLPIGEDAAAVFPTSQESDRCKAPTDYRTRLGSNV